MRTLRLTAVILAVVVLLPLPAQAGRPLAAVETFDYSQNLHPLGFSERAFDNSSGLTGWNSDLAFWGSTVIQGAIDGFRIINASAPANPTVITDYRDCPGDQGDVIVWENIVVRSWNSPAPAGASCGGVPVAAGTEGVHVFDISNPTSPQMVKYVPIACGSHTATGVPDAANNRLLVYNSASNNNCPWIDIVEVPLDAPGDAEIINRVDSMHTCHDIGVILGDANRAACAGGSGARIFSLDPADGGSLDDPMLMTHFEIPGVTIGHSAAWTWDGEVLVFGHEPGGGVAPRCQESTADVDKTLFFYDHEGNQLGTMLFPRPQTAAENCTWHNYNIVPTDKRYVMVSGNYQAGISVVDFTDPANAREIAYADPAPLPFTPASPFGLQLGGDWSSYWYNGVIYQSDITRGLITWKLSDPAVAGAKKLSHMNPQTQEFSFPARPVPRGR